MSTIGLLVEGGIDEELVPQLLRDVLTSMKRRAGKPTDFVYFPFPPNGFGEIPKNLRHLIKLHRDSGGVVPLGCDIFVIILDAKKTEGVQTEIKKILRSAQDFPAIFGLAVLETEAWVLGDIEHVNQRVFQVPFTALPHKPERDPDPKETLTNLFVLPSKHVEFDRWNRECARRVAPHLRHAQVKFSCPRGFGRLAQALNDHF